MRIDIHHHFHLDDARAVELLSTILNRSDTIMTTLEELQAKLDEAQQTAIDEHAEVQAALGTMSAQNDALKAEIQALRDQIAAGALVTQEQLDSLFDKASAVTTAIEGIQDTPAAPAEG